MRRRVELTHRARATLDFLEAHVAANRPDIVEWALRQYAASLAPDIAPDVRPAYAERLVDERIAISAERNALAEEIGGRHG